MNDEERRDAEALRGLLAGEDARPPSDEAEAAGLLLHASGQPAIADEASDRVWDRVRTAAPKAPAAGRSWAWLGYAAAASIVLLLLSRAPEPAPLPEGPSASQRQAAIAALDPSYGPPMRRLAALHTVAAAERERLVAEMSRGE